MTRVPIVAALVVVVTFAPIVRAQTSSEDRAAADVLYEQSGTLMKAGHFVEACPKLETSQRLDPGVGTLLRLGYCYEHVGRTASAFSAYNDAEAQARRSNDGKRADDAAGRAKALEPKLSRLLVVSSSAAPGQEVRRDGKPVDAGLLGTAVPVDPGEHVIEVIAPGRQPWKTSVHIEATAGSVTVTVPELVAAAVIAPPKEVPASPFWSGQRVGGVVAGSFGVAGLVVGVALGVDALSKNSASKQNCDPTNPNFCNTTGASGRSDAIHVGNGSTAALVVGSVLLAGGIVLAVTAPSSKKSDAARVELVPGVGALALRGRF